MIFVLLGLTPEARATYWRGIHAVSKLIGHTPPTLKHEELGEIQFGARQLTMTELYVSHLGFRNRNLPHMCVDLSQALLRRRMGDRTSNGGMHCFR
jgi:hypothetical protein